MFILFCVFDFSNKAERPRDSAAKFVISGNYK